MANAPSLPPQGTNHVRPSPMCAVAPPAGATRAAFSVLEVFSSERAKQEGLEVALVASACRGSARGRRAR